MKENKNEYYATSDFCLATTLLVYNADLESLDKSDPKRIQFCFKNTLELKSLVNLYKRNKLQITPAKFYFAQRQLKTQMYEEANNAS